MRQWRQVTHERSGELLGGPWAGGLADLFMPMVWMLVAYSIAVVRLQRKYG